MSNSSNVAPPLSVTQWFNTDGPITLEALRGRVVIIHAFQMLCPGCVAHGLPQAMKVHQAFTDHEVVVLGLHTVFEHHDAMTPNALKAFLGEYRIAFPVGVDRHVNDRPIPSTMQAYEMRGTPNLIVIDRQGVLRLNHSGRMDDLQLGVLLGTLLSEPTPDQPSSSAESGVDEKRHSVKPSSCDEHQCAVCH